MADCVRILFAPSRDLGLRYLEKNPILIRHQPNIRMSHNRLGNFDI